MTALHPEALGHVNGNGTVTGAGFIFKDAMHFYTLFAGLSGALLLLMLTWGAFQLQNYRITGVGVRDDTHSLIGRTVYSALVIAAGPLIIWTLFHVNNVIVTTLLDPPGKHFYNAFSIVHANLGSIGGTLAAGGVAAEFMPLILEVLGLAVVVFVLWAIVVWFARQFEIVFWVTLWPVAAALGAADPQQKFFNYVKSQVVGLAFTQAAMALTLYLTLNITYSLGGSGYVKGSGVGDLLIYGVMGAGFYFTAQVPKYWKEINGHSTSGGHEMAALAGGYMLGRFGSQALASTKMGKLTGAAMEHIGARNENYLQTQAGKEGLASDAVGDYFDTRTAGMTAALSATQSEGGFKGFAAGLAMGATRMGRGLAVGATDLAARSGRTKLARHYVAQKSHTARLSAENRSWQSQADRVAGVGEATVNAEANEQLTRSAGLQAQPEDAAILGGGGHGGSSGGGAIPGASTPTKNDLNKAPFPGMWPTVQSQLAQRASGMTDQIRALQNAGADRNIGGIRVRGNPKYRDAALSMLQQQRNMYAASQSPQAAQQFMLEQPEIGGWGSVEEMRRDPNAQDKIMNWIATRTQPLQERTSSDNTHLVQGVAPHLVQTINRYGSQHRPRPSVGSVDFQS